MARLPKTTNATNATFTNRSFIAFFLFLLIAGIGANSADWWLDIAFLAIIYAILWHLCRRYPQTRSTIILALVIPAPHMLGAFGLYHRGIGGVSWDVLVHITTSFNAVLLLHSFFTSSTSTLTKRLGIVIILAILAGGVIEIIEQTAGDALQRQGEGLFYRGAGDYCSDQSPCSTAVDTKKDFVDNLLGVLLGTIAVSYASIGRHTGASGRKGAR